MADEIPFTLDGRAVIAVAGETIWQVAKRHGTEIPHLCLSNEPDFHPDGNCRLCVVEVVGRRNLAASCSTKPQPGMQVVTNSGKASNARRTVMELLLAEAEVPADSECARWGRAMGISSSRYPAGARTTEFDHSHPGIDVTLSACIHCRRCVQACRELMIHDVIGMSKRGVASKIIFDFDVPMGTSTCVSCGACAQTCPTGAITFRRQAV
ncbi:MAG: 2Fe-2S iron-sulfur cluster-binding protein [Rhodospirillaceae bacterium]